MTPEFLANLLQAILDGEEDELILAMLAPLGIDELQNLSYAGIRLDRFCREAFRDLPNESDKEE